MNSQNNNLSQDNIETIEKSLKNSFVTTANQLTILYTNSINFQKESFIQGYKKSIKETIEWILQQGIFFFLYIKVY